SFAPFIFVLSVMAIIYTSFVALAQEDMKKLIAYSSVAHMGFVTMGIFSLTHQGIEGGIYQMLSHGVVSGALFLCVGVIYDRMHTREIAAYGGLVARMPMYAACLMVFTLANVGLPGTGGFVGEFLTMLGTFRVNTWVVIFAATGAILSAAYMLYLYWRVIFGRLVKPALQTIQDLSLREFAILSPLVIITIVMGVYPNFVFDVTHASVANLVHQGQLTMQRESHPPLEGGSKFAQQISGRGHAARVSHHPSPNEFVTLTRSTLPQGEVGSAVGVRAAR
ncbi:MAG TPA: NADH-quinone oxidoreductase subunit M, partial [Rhizomicrobium sp.]|nr:NADH-quinone oxidoreductase subunit M [Rhizomicrobium sp.]